MRCDGKPVRPGTRTTHRMSKASEPEKQNGTLFADSIRASSLNRLHQQAGQKTAPDQCHCVNLSLATREPSTEDSSRTIALSPKSAINGSPIFTCRLMGDAGWDVIRAAQLSAIPPRI